MATLPYCYTASSIRRYVGVKLLRRLKMRGLRLLLVLVEDRVVTVDCHCQILGTLGLTMLRLEPFLITSLLT